MQRREALEAELSRREALEAELARREAGPQQSSIYETPYIGKGLSALTGFEEALASPVSGALQLVGANDLAKSMHDYWTNQYSKSKAINPKLTMSGNVAGNVLPFAIGTGAASEIPMLANMFKAIPAAAQLPLAGGVGGAISGGLEYAEPEESHLGNALTGGLVGTALGSIPGAAKGAINLTKKAGTLAKKGYAKYFGEKSAPQISKELRSLAEGHKQVSSQNYNELLNKVNEAGIKLKAPETHPHEIEYILENGTPNSKKAIKLWLENPTIENTHSAMKKLGKASVSATDKELKGMSGKAKRYLEKEMFGAFEEAGKPELAKQFKAANKYHMENVLPFENKLIKKLITSKSTQAKRLANAAKNVDVEESLLTYHPELWKDIERHIANPANRTAAKKRVLEATGWLGAEELLRHHLK